MHVGWISIGNDDFGSTRIGVTNIHKGLVSNGYSSTILNYNTTFNINIDADIEYLKKRIIDEKINVVVFHKVCSVDTQNLVLFCKKNKVKTIYANGDWNHNPMNLLVDHVISGSIYVRDILSTKYGVTNSHCIEDALETTGYPCKKTRTLKDVDNLNLGWFGNFTKLEYAQNFIKNLNVSNVLLKTISNAPSRYTDLQPDYTMGAATSKPWDTDFLIKYLLENIDVIVIPLNLEEGNLEQHYAKTANRVTFGMSLGIPVVATPIPSYEKVITDGLNGFLPKDELQWEECLTLLRDSSFREKIGKHSMKHIQDKYHINNIVKDWINIFKM